MTILHLSVSLVNGWASFGLLGRIRVILWKDRRWLLVYGWRD